SNLDNNLADKDEIEQLALARIRDEQYWSKLRFKTRDETYKFYTDYAHSTGFSVRKASSVRKNSSSSSATHYLRYVCNKEGCKEDSELDPKNDGKLATKKRKRLRAEQRTGCTTIIVFHPDQDAGCYFINEWKDEHNHALHKVEHKQFHRKQWSSVWVKNNFTCGMRSSQLSESLNSNLRGYLHSKDNLSTFFTQFQRMLDNKRADELELDYQATNNAPVNIFKSSNLVCEAAKVDDVFCAFDWYRLDDDNTTRLDERTVTFDFSKLTFECECRLFGSSGWLCRHILKSLDTLASSGYPAATSIPSQYIKKCWCKTAKIGFTLGVSISSREVPQSNRSRFEELSTFMISMAAEFHVDVEVYNKIKEDLLEVQSRGRTMLIERRTTMGHHPPSVP
ncbi:Protein FAR-RED IMPAIRED RESPONSE 1, partial [Linum perenne]